MISRLFNIRTTHKEDENILNYWREKLFHCFFSITLLLAFIPYSLSSKLAVTNSNWITFTAYSIIYCWGVTVLFTKRIPFPVRIWSGIICFYCLGVYIMSETSLMGSGRLYLLCFSALAAIFLTIKETIITIIINILTLIGFGILFSKTGMASKHGNLPFSAFHWVLISGTFIFLNSVVTLSIATLIKALETSGKRLSHLVHNTSDILWSLDKNFKITFINPAVKHILGYSPKHLTGKSFIPLLNEAGQKEFKNLLNLNSFYKNKIIISHKNGHPVHVELNASKTTKASGNQTSYQGLIRDISSEISRKNEQQQLQDKLNQAKKLKDLGILAGSVAHDLNNTLSGIATYPEVLLINDKLDYQTRQGLTLIKDSGQKAAAVVSDLLTISRGVGAPKEVLNINDIIERYIRAHDFKEIKKNFGKVDIEVATEPELLNIEGSYIHLEKLIMNLVINAVEEVSCKDNGKVIICTENYCLDSMVKKYKSAAPGEYAVLKIMDNGSGIEDKNIKKIFEPFFTKKVMGKSGTGLGLTVVWNTVQDHNGHIFVSSGEQGSRFEVLFPVIQQNITQKTQTTPIEEINGQGETILIVDDLTEQQEIAITILKSLGYRAEAVSNGYEAVDYIEYHNVDLVILDMIMEPHISGLETFKLLKQKQPDMKAVLASGFSKSEDVVLAQELGAGSFVKKPYSINDLGVAIKKELKK